MHPAGAHRAYDGSQATLYAGALRIRFRPLLKCQHKTGHAFRWSRADAKVLTNISDGKSVDVSQRRPFSRQLTQEQDAEIIADYGDPTFVLGGWTPVMAPLILTQPAAVVAETGQTAIFSVEVAAIPAAIYQWFKDGVAIDGATDATLRIEDVDAGDAAAYSVTATNESGCVTSQAAALTVK